MEISDVGVRTHRISLCKLPLQTKEGQRLCICNYLNYFVHFYTDVWYEKQF